jgi:hypothetical protein
MDIAWAPALAMAKRIALVIGVKTRMGYFSLISKGSCVRQKNDEI